MEFLTEWKWVLGLLCGLTFWGFAVWLAVRRVQSKLGRDAQPTVWTYVNELGGYIAVGALILISLVVALVKNLMG